MLVIFTIIVLIFSAVVHEVSHGFVAEKLGDPTARLAGRLTLNPLKHLDPFGSVLLPILLYFASGGAFVFGWAKPVPYNPFNLKNPEREAALIAAAGPITNITIALILSVLYRTLFNSMSITGELILVIIQINILLGIFNIVPLPPLDGAKVAVALMPDRWGNVKRFFYEQNTYGWILLGVFIFIGMPVISPVIYWVFHVFTGA